MAAPARFNRAAVATVAFLGLIAGVVVFRTITIPAVTCDLCVTFHGQTECRTAASGTREAAIASAVTSACGTLAAGMTESIACENTPPERVECRAH